VGWGGDEWATVGWAGWGGDEHLPASGGNFVLPSAFTQWRAVALLRTKLPSLSCDVSVAAESMTF